MKRMNKRIWSRVERKRKGSKKGVRDRQEIHKEGTDISNGENRERNNQRNTHRERQQVKEALKKER